MARSARRTAPDSSPETRDLKLQLGEAYGQRRDADDPGRRLERLMWLLVHLWKNGAIDKSTYKNKFGLSDSSFLRDIATLEAVAHRTGLTIRNRRGVVRVENRSAAPKEVPSTGLARMLQAVADALGPPVARALSPLVGDATSEPQFYHLAMPRFASGHVIVQTYDDLEQAFQARATVEFTYTTKRSETSERRVEPHCVIQHGGRYYLVAYCHSRRDWRFFALDAISGGVRRVGTVQKPRTPTFDLDASIGFIRGDEPPTEVTVRIAPDLAAAIRSQRWQAQQRIVADPDGGLQLTVEVSDFAEIARWSMSFGDRATVVSPPAAVAVARDLLESSLAKYAPPASRRQKKIA